jgi:hypothetical protein
MKAAVSWPDGKRFAFSIFDDPDSQTLEQSQAVYGLLADLGLRTTKSVWPNAADPQLASDPGVTCGHPAYVEWLLQLQQLGFEIGYHNATSHTSAREQTLQGLDRFKLLFGHQPHTMSNHYYCQESIYWGAERLSGVPRHLYNALTLGRNRGQSFGHVQKDPRFWGDLCRERVRYVRNFVFGDINTLAACPWMPYHDPDRPYVTAWYASSEASDISRFLRCLAEAEQDRLEEEGGACILYLHFAHGFYAHGSLQQRFVELVRRLSRKNGWFVPVNRLLDHLREQRRDLVITASQRATLERRWLRHKIRAGSA